MTHDLMVAASERADQSAQTRRPVTHGIARTGLSIRPDDDLSVHLPVLLVGLRWLFDTEQPIGAVQCPAGDSLPSVGGRGFRFIPSDRDGRAALGIAVTTGDTIGGHEVAGFIDLLEEMGEEVVAVDAIAAGSFCRLTLARAAHPTLRRAVARYRADHLEHANASPFGPARRSDVVNAVSAADLHRQVLQGKPTVAAGDRLPTPVVYRIDLLDHPTTTSVWATHPESHFATQS